MSSGTAEAPPPEQPPAPRPDVCPNCGAPLPPGQDWCLNCGAPARTRIAGTPIWRLPVALVGVLIVLLGAAVAVAFVQLSDDSKDVGKTDSVASAPTTSPTNPTTSTTPTVPGATTTPTVPGATTTPTVPETTIPTTPGSTTTTPTIPEATGGSGEGGESGTPNKPSPKPAPAKIASWPAGRTAYTAVLMSASSKSEADAKAKSLANRGVDVGVLHSNDFSSLEPGYWVVFSGHYAGLAPAQAAAQRLAGQGAAGAYGRLVKP